MPASHRGGGRPESKNEASSAGSDSTFSKNPFIPPHPFKGRFFQIPKFSVARAKPPFLPISGRRGAFCDFRSDERVEPGYRPGFFHGRIRTLLYQNAYDNRPTACVPRPRYVVSLTKPPTNVQPVGLAEFQPWAPSFLWAEKKKTPTAQGRIGFGPPLRARPRAPASHRPAGPGGRAFPIACPPTVKHHPANRRNSKKQTLRSGPAGKGAGPDRRFSARGRTP